MAGISDECAGGRRAFTAVVSELFLPRRCRSSRSARCEISRRGTLYVLLTKCHDNIVT